MFLKTLVVRGFKTFAERTTLAFEPGISVVVGPNGSGKSNLVDAIIWVLGEQGTATLRGGRMEDVIFAGTATKPPLGMAEVQLTIDNSSGVLSIAYSEVSIARTLFRSGDSEYRLNGTACRLLDIQELLSDAGVGREQHTIVGQGRIDEVLSADAVQMRGFIEDAAGVGKHRRRKERALRKIQSSETNLAHLGDLLNEIRRQLRPLRQQAELAEKHERLSRELYQVRVVSTARQLSEVMDKMGPADLSENHEWLASTKQAELAGLDGRLGALQQERIQSAALSTSQREVQWRLKAGTERLSSLKRLAEERQRTLAAELSSHSEAVEHARLVELKFQMNELEAALPEAQQLQATEAVSLAEISALGEQARQRLRGSEELVARSAAEQAEVNAEVSGQHKNEVALSGSREAAEREAGRVAERLRLAMEKRNTARIALDEATRAALAREAERERVAGAIEEAEERKAELEALSARLLEEIRGLEKESAVLRARAGARASARRSVAARAASLRADPGVLLLSDLVELEPGHKRALETLVGPIDEVVVVADEASAEQALSNHNPDDALTVLVGGRLPLGVPGVERLSEKVRLLSDRAGHLLADVYLAGSLAEAITLAGQHRHAVFITSDGALAMGSFVSRGSREVADAIQRCEDRLVVARDGMNELQDQLRRAGQRVRETINTRQAHEAGLAEANHAVRLHERQLHGFQAEIGQLEDSSAAIGSSLEAIAQQSRAAVRKLELAEAAAHTNEAQIAQLRVEHAASGQQLDETSKRLEDARVRVGIAGERCRELTERADGVKVSLTRAQSRLAGLGMRQEALSGSRDRAGSIAAVAALLIGRTAGWAEEAGEHYRRSLENVEEIDQQLAHLRQQRQHNAAELDELRARARRVDLGRSDLKVRQRILEARLADDLHADPESTLRKLGHRIEVAENELAQDPLQRAASLPDDALRKRQGRLERELEQMGQVNPLAAREAEALEEREEFLATQIADVKASRKDLREIVESVDQKIKVLFSAAFEDVSGEFERLFPILFPSGRGRLRLSDPTELLESGVEVEASPQGRNLKRLSLLSGGEKALSALALLFSIFRARPSPFYILDEVEAALDDVNLQRFLSLLAEFRGTSQLLVVSHQKRTMEIADVLYGVVLRPDGASKVISERLSDLFPA